jgi:hypothetical protein
MMSRMVPKPFSLVSHSWILSRLRLSLRAVNESSKTPAVFLWATVKTCLLGGRGANTTHSSAASM